MAPPKKDIPPLPPEPPELKEKRDKLLAELDVQGKTAQGTFLQVVRNMRRLVASSAPNSPLDEQMYKDVTEALNRFMKDPILPPPAILGSVVEYLQHRLTTYGVTIQNAVMEMNPEAGAKLAMSPLPEVPASVSQSRVQSRPSGKASDGFESSSGSRKMALNPEAVPPPPAEPKAQQQQLDSFKAWMKNPSLGKLKG
ncbi:hypothetical protein [Corallococcus aberystwythensis]|uniref:Uncharacterized protein n=1 Tax=Corallococcus aberystwythensis TaxID=2316722 RepID=A0A3A8PV79_9BACT|nr:hypothetical protein [Corallococcus aberystwythensis]RKH60377.1 hypothetical protein D7W81_25715 [Corallococcus aberystwythensis]